MTQAQMKTERPAGLLGIQLHAVGMLLRRDLVRFFRQRSRIVGALLQPLIFWLVIGSGLSGSFRMPSGQPIGYMQYFYPGTLVLVVLFTSIFTTMSVIEDRQRGFLQAVLTAPVARISLVLGKSLGSVTIALLQACLFLLLSPLAGFAPSRVDWPLLLVALGLIGLALSSVGFAIAWWLNSTQGYHVLMTVLLIPLWILSGAMFPPEGARSWLRLIMTWNPLAYGVSLVRGALSGPLSLGVVGAAPGTVVQLLIVAAFALFAEGLASVLCARRT
jgi:daunorubicin resistance ABC transporter membrane protein